MRKIKLTILFLAISTAAFCQTKLGAQAVYGANSEFGVGAKVIFKMSDAINISPSINYFFGKSVTGASSSVMGFNVDGHYTVDGGDGLVFYPLAGLNATRYSISVLGRSASNTKFGFNLGGGLNYNFSSSLTGILEGKYVIGTYNQAVFSAGILFNL